MTGERWIRPDAAWPARVRVLSTLRPGGVSTAPYDSFNLATHVGDDPARVAANRAVLRERGGLPAEPLWLEQVHGHTVVVHGGPLATPPRADAAVAFATGQVCVVMTADCLPVVLADRAGTRVAVAHAGWRGLAGGVLEATVAAMDATPGGLVAWLGPAIGQGAFEVGPEVREAFVNRLPSTVSAFRSGALGKFHADLYALARSVLGAAGVADVHGGEWCTATDAVRFFSYRRDGRTGRMATLAWLE